MEAVKWPSTFGRFCFLRCSCCYGMLIMATIVLCLLGLFTGATVSPKECIQSTSTNVTIGVLVEEDDQMFSPKVLLERMHSGFSGIHISVIPRIVVKEDRLGLIDAVIEVLTLHVQGLLLTTSCERSNDLLAFITDLHLDHRLLVDSECTDTNSSESTGSANRQQHISNICDILLNMVTWEHSEYLDLIELTIIYDDTFEMAQIMEFTERLSDLDAKEGHMVPSFLDFLDTKTLDLSQVTRGNLSYFRNLRQDPRRWTYLVVFCSQINTDYVLRQASVMGLNTRFHFWIVLNVDVSMFGDALEKWGDGNLLLVRPSMEGTRSVRCFLSQLPKVRGPKDMYQPLTEALNIMVASIVTSSEGKIEEQLAEPSNCSEGWKDPAQVQHVPQTSLDTYQIMSVLTTASSSKIKQRFLGKDLIPEARLVEQATWSGPGGLRVRGRSLFPHPPDDLQGHTFTVTFPAGNFMPYIAVKEGASCCSRDYSPTDDWPLTGFCVDLFKEHARRLNFTVRFYKSPPGIGVGSREANGSWSGLIGMIIREENDMLIGPITLTPDRVLSVAFTGPYVQDLLSLIMLQRKTYSITRTKIFVTFSLQVWAAIFGSVCLIGGVLYLVHLSKGLTNSSGKELLNRCEKGKETDQLAHGVPITDSVKTGIDDGKSEWPLHFTQNQMGMTGRRSILSNIYDNKTFIKTDKFKGQSPISDSRKKGQSLELPSNDSSKDTSIEDHETSLLDSLWGSYGLYLDQGAGIYPSSTSGRLAVGTLWLFTITISAIYTANLTASLSVSAVYRPVRGISDLADPKSPLQPLILKDTNLRELFMRAAPDTVYGRVWTRLQHVPDDLPNDLGEAFDLLHTGKYALIQEEGLLRAKISTDCESFMLAEQGFHPSNLGFVLKKNSPYQTIFDMIGVKLQESGIVDKYREQWWPTTRGCEDGGTSQAAARRLGLSHMAGAFVVVANAVVAALLALGCEVLWGRYQRQRPERSEKGIVCKMTELNGDDRRWNQIL